MMGKPSDRLILKGAWSAALSTLLWLTSMCLGQAHEVRPSVADVDVTADRVRMEIRVVLEPLIAGINLAGLEDTDDSPLSGLYDRLRAESPAALETALRAAWPNLAKGILFETDGTVGPAEIVSLSVPEIGDLELPRDSRLVIEAALPPGTAPVRVGWSSSFGPLVVRQVGDATETAYSAILNNGDLSEPLPREGVATESALTVFVRFIISGFEHIIPKGIDHILFVLGLFFYALRTGPLLWQITAFTLAHTVTLALASLGVVTVPASVVEPLIALSIAYVAAENIWANRPGRSLAPVNWARIAVVFGFGLLHGLGFAFVLGDVGLEAGRFVVGLIGFNIGVEIGQLAVVAVAFALLGLPFGRRSWYTTAIAIPASVVIGLIGLYWTYERVRVFLG